MIEYKETKLINDNELRPLYESVGWVSYTNEISDLNTLLTNCQLVYSAWHKGELVGLIRTVGDDISIQYIQDILVLPEYQKQGIGAKLLKQVIESSKNIRQLVLMTDGNEENNATIEFYKKQGFRPFDEIGICGLWRMMN